ncbi:Na-Ca exchanger/integrin-beta4, partial [Catenovulum agarivorans DS-2]
NVTGGNFENLVLGSNEVTTSVSDTVSDVTLNLSATPSVAEGGSITYTASLSAAAETDMSITLSNGEVINIAAGQSSGSVSSIAAGQSSGSVSVDVSDDVYIGADDITAS